MRIRLLSDLHLEFFGPHAHRFIESLDNDCDVLVLAGDIDVSGIGASLAVFAERFKRVVYVAGNHEFYASSPMATHDRLRNAAAKTGVHWLENDTVTIDGQRFIGCTMWFAEPPCGAPKHHMTDYQVIHNFEPWVYKQNNLSRALLDIMLPSDVVVTHHLPSPLCTPARFADSPLNPFFVCDMRGEIQCLRPKLWLHGHTHSSLDFMIEDTRIVCNPHGYYGHEMNAGFDPLKTITI